MPQSHRLSRREREIMDVLFQKGQASARDVCKALSGECTNSTIRKILSIMEEKGFVKHKNEGATFIYSPEETRERAADSVIDRLVNTFFEGSAGNAVSGLLGRHQESLSMEDLDRLENLIARAKEGKTQ